MVVNTQFHKFYGRSKKWRGIFRVAAEVCSSQTRLGLRTFFETFMHVYVRTLRTTKYIQGKKKNESPLGGQVSGWTCTCVQKFRVYLLDRNGVDIKFWRGKHV